MIDKKLKVNVVFNLINQVMLVIIPFVTAPYISRVLGAERIGEFSLAQSIVSFFVLFAVLGTGLFGQRTVAYNKDSIENRSKVFWEVWLLRFVMVCIMSTLYVLLIVRTVSNRFLYILCMIEIIAVIVDVSWFFQGIEKFYYLSIFSVLSRLIGAILIFSLVHSEQDLLVYAGITIGCNFLVSLLNWFLLPNEIIFISMQHIKCFRNLSSVLQLFISQTAIQIYTMLDKPMIGFITKSNFENGYYEQSQKIIKIVLGIISAFGAVLSTRIASLWEKGEKEEIYQLLDKVMQIVLCVSMPMCVGLCIISPRMVPLYFGEGYVPVILLIQIFSLVIPIIGCSNVIGIQLLIPSGREKYLTYSVCMGAITNVVCNFVLIPNLGALGAAIGSVIAELVVTTVQLWIVRKEMNIKKITIMAGKYLFLAILMGIIGSKICNMISNDFLSLGITFVVCVVFYFSIEAIGTVIRTRR